MHGRALSFLIGLATAGGDLRSAEGWLLELLALVAFSEQRDFGTV